MAEPRNDDASTDTDALVQVSHHDGVALVELANGKANTLSTAVLAQLADAAEGMAASGDAPGAVVITGRGRMFAAGAEISEFGGPDEATTIGAAFHRALDAVAAVPAPVIAAVNGFALGGGCELALACDLRIAADDASLGQPEILLGIIPGGGGTQRLARLVGAARAKDLILTGRRVGAEEALAMGLVDRVVPAATLRDEAMALAASFAAGPRVAQALAKRAIDEGLDGSMSDGLALERQLFTEVFGTEDAATGVASFLEHGPGKATFRGR
jgi:enoyl-CoA hydratase/carnithine racemase